MELEIQDALIEYFANIKIEVNYKDIRKYEIYLQLETMEHRFIYGYNAYLTFEANIDIIKKEIEKCILDYYKR